MALHSVRAMETLRPTTSNGSVWSVVLAGGSGSRLSELARDAGTGHVPKQYCSLVGGPTLLDVTLDRAARHAGECRVLVVVAAEHETWWRASQAQWDGIGFVVQPEDRGTVAGLYLALDTIRRVDPDAVVLVLPADHHVDDEKALSSAIETALGEIGTRGGIALLGAEPEGADGELGWIVPTRAGERISRIAEFREKPGAGAAELLQRGAVVSTFVMAARLRDWLSAVLRTTPEVPRAFARFRAGGPYGDIPRRDLSRHVLERKIGSLRVVRVPPCGWSDLGVPARLEKVIGELRHRGASTGPAFRTPVLADLLPFRQVPARRESPRVDDRPALPAPERHFVELP
jgi:mannose-1-phosphate guanylyltransferase